MTIAKYFLGASPGSFSALFFPCAFWFVPGFLISLDMNICVHYNVNFKGMEVASLSVSTADDGAVVALADFKSVNYLRKNIYHLQQFNGKHS